MKTFRQIFITVVISMLLFTSVAYGITWTANKRLTNHVGFSVYPAIAVDGLNIYVVWHDDPQENGNIQIYFKKSDDGGATWTKKRLTWNTSVSMNPAIAVDSSNIYVVWHDYRLGSPEIYFKKSDDGGATWTTSRNLTNSAGYSICPSIAVDGSNIYVAWQEDYEIYFKKSADGGATWTASINLSNTVGLSGWPAIAVDGSDIHVVWNDDTLGNYEIYFKKSDDGGATWSKNKNLTNNASYSYDPAIAVDGSNIYVVWEDWTPGNPEIYFKKSDDGGATWSKNKNLANNLGDSWDCAIAADGSNIYVVWSDYTLGNYEIYFKKSNDGGATWTTSKNLSNNAGLSDEPSIAVDGSNIYVVWTDDTPGNYDIYFKKGVLY